VEVPDAIAREARHRILPVAGVVGDVAVHQVDEIREIVSELVDRDHAADGALLNPAFDVTEIAVHIADVHVPSKRWVGVVECKEPIRWKTHRGIVIEAQ
jgi:hypothetical protein